MTQKLGDLHFLPLATQWYDPGLHQNLAVLYPYNFIYEYNVSQT